MGLTEREVAVAERETDVARREADVQVRELALAERLLGSDVVLAAADLRDIDAEVRDDVAVELDRASDLAEFVAPAAHSYGGHNAGRRHAALDRDSAKSDRSSSAEDRRALAGVDEPEHEPDV